MTMTMTFDDDDGYDDDDDVSTFELGTPYRTGHTTSLLNSSSYHAVVVHEVFAELDVDKAHVLHHQDGGIAVSAVYLEVECSAGIEQTECVGRYAAIEKEGVGIGNEQCLMGFMVEDVGCHILALGVADVGWIAHYDVELGGIGIGVHFLKCVMVLEMDLQSESAGVVSGYTECFMGDVPCRDFSIGEPLC